MKIKKHHEVEDARVEKGVLRLVVDGTALECDLSDLSPLFADATDEEQRRLEISPSGYGIHWPLIDEDISIDGLLGIVHEPDASRRSA